MIRNFLLVAVSAVLSCVLATPCLALQKTWGDVLQDVDMDEIATYPDKTPDRLAGDGEPVNPNPDPKDNFIFIDGDISKILARFDSEPSIQETQNAAIKYAEVHNEKIRQWRKEARQKALLPTLSVGVDRDIKNTSEIYTSASQSYWTTGPDNKTTSWDVSVSWDLGDLIWNDDQTSIDVRSRLMVQLRDDILNEVTKVYFERRRLQIELLTNPPKNIQHKLNKELRLQELTAGIDALTGGWFSKNITRN